MSESYIYENPTGSEGLFTFNFFCESVTGALHTLIHVMEDHELEAPDSLSEIPEHLAQIGIAFSEDYASHKLDLGRFKEDILSFYDLAFTSNDQLAPLVIGAPEEVTYYYLVYSQGINLMFTNLLQSIVRDLPDSANPQSFIQNIMHDFYSLSGGHA